MAEDTPGMQMRERVLRGSAGDFGVAPRGETWGVVMDMGFPDGSASVLALADGNASLYFSTGGGVIGGAAHASVRAAAVAFCEMGDAMRAGATATRDFPLPPPDTVRFYLLTTSAVLAMEANEDELGEERHALSPLFLAGQDVITQLRLVSGGRD